MTVYCTLVVLVADYQQKESFVLLEENPVCCLPRRDWDGENVTLQEALAYLLLQKTGVDAQWAQLRILPPFDRNKELYCVGVCTLARDFLGQKGRLLPVREAGEASWEEPDKEIFFYAASGLGVMP